MIETMLKNYHSERHMLQTCHVGAFGTPFVYMKNHKAACTTVLASIMGAMKRERGDTDSLDMETVHTPSRDLLRAGPRAISSTELNTLLNDPKVFKFTIVRDPVARTVSAWADKISKKDVQHKRLMKYLGRDKTEDLSLSEFLDIIAHNSEALDFDRHWRPQRKDISYDQIDYDLIGDMADLSESLSKIMTQLFGPSRYQIDDTRKSMGHKTSSRSFLADLTEQDRRNLMIALESDFAMYDAVQKASKDIAA